MMHNFFSFPLHRQLPGPRLLLKAFAIPHGSLKKT